ncbi:hypothetical protein [Compostimonas suwonensis]|nr:hypothetical protein [Compostimonas suwonensis]
MAGRESTHSPHRCCRMAAVLVAVAVDGMLAGCSGPSLIAALDEPQAREDTIRPMRHTRMVDPASTRFLGQSGGAFFYVATRVLGGVESICLVRRVPSDPLSWSSSCGGVREQPLILEHDGDRYALVADRYPADQLTEAGWQEVADNLWALVEEGR